MVDKAADEFFLGISSCREECCVGLLIDDIEDYFIPIVFELKKFLR